MTLTDYLLAHWPYYFYVMCAALYLPILAMQLPEKAEVL